MSEQSAFERIVASLHDAMLDDSHWPTTSALIDEACDLTGNALLVPRRPAGRPPGPLRRALPTAGSAASTWSVSTSMSIEEVLLRRRPLFQRGIAPLGDKGVRRHAEVLAWRSSRVWRLL